MPEKSVNFVETPTEIPRNPKANRSTPAKPAARHIERAAAPKTMRQDGLQDLSGLDKALNQHASKTTPQASRHTAAAAAANGPIPARTPGAGGAGQHKTSTRPVKPPGLMRGMSAIDNTALVSADPTPAAEISNPMNGGVTASGLLRGGSRQRESHLPDLEVLQQEARVGGSGQKKRRGTNA